MDHTFATIATLNVPHAMDQTKTIVWDAIRTKNLVTLSVCLVMFLLASIMVPPMYSHVLRFVETG